MKVLFVHGVGFHEGDLEDWTPRWQDAIQNAAQLAGAEIEIDNPLGDDGLPGGPDRDPGVLYYEDIVADYPNPSGFEYAKAVAALLSSYVQTKIGGLFRDRGFGDLISDELKWKAREVAGWVVDEDMRRALRKRVVEQVEEKDPDVVVAHSYGGLITYDACLFEDPDLLKDRYLVTIGTQIGNPLLRREFGGRQQAVKAKHWFNLYNPGDKVFVSPLDHIDAENFSNLTIAHEHGHSGVGYLGHPETGSNVWLPIALGRRWTAGLERVRSLHHRAVRPPNRRALLIGIDRYQHDSISKLEGCVNDTFLLSAALQESGFQPDEIRILHNERATKDRILDEMDWLLDGVRDGDNRFLSYSGHGHRVPAFELSGELAEYEELLVTHDYDFDGGGGIRDKDIFEMYADLPQGCHFLMFLDCCHSGGLDRASGPLVRSVTGPPDIEHHCVKWNAKLQMWEQRGLNPIQEIDDFAPKSYSARREQHSAYYGNRGDTRKIGRASYLRDLPHAKYDRIRAALRKGSGVATNGPYLPLIFMACTDEEKASEYVHGSVSYGAFTFAMVLALRELSDNQRTPNFLQLLERAKSKLGKLGYGQSPQIHAHPDQKKAKGPFASKPSKKRAAAKKKAPAKRKRKAPAKAAGRRK